MQKIYFKKLVDLNHQLKELVSISVDESINYKMETKGMRAIGSIMINGEYKDTQSKKSFHETIDLDIMAIFEKITDKRDFHVKVEDFDYSLSDGNLNLVIQTCVYGVLDDEDRVIETTPTQVVEESQEQDAADQIESLLREADQEDQTLEDFQEPVVEEKQEQVLPVEEEIPVIQKEDNEDDDEDLGTYYLYIVRDGDTYQTIANHYQVDEYQLKDYNHDRPLSKGVIVIVPYTS